MKHFLFVFFLLTSLALHAQIDMHESLTSSAEKYNGAFINEDFETYVNMTIPSVVELAGGFQLMLDNIKENHKLNASTGLKTVSITPEKVEKFVNVGNEIHAILPQKVINSFQETKFSRTMYYLAISTDGGKTWSFLDLEPYSGDTLSDYVPSFTGELVVPEFKQPEIID